MRIINPYLIALYFYKRNKTNEVPPVNLTGDLTLVKDKSNYKSFKGMFRDTEYMLEWFTCYDDIVVLRFSLLKTGELFFETWLEQRESIAQITKNPGIPKEGFIGASIMYWGLVYSLEDEEYKTNLPTMTEFGNLLQLRSQENNGEMVYILLTPKTLEKKTGEDFLFTEDGGL